MKKIYFNSTTKKFDKVTIKMIGEVESIIKVDLNVPFIKLRKEEIIPGVSIANMSEKMLANCSFTAYRAYIDMITGKLTSSPMGGPVPPKIEVISAYKLLKTEILYRCACNEKLIASEEFKKACDKLNNINIFIKKNFE